MTRFYWELELGDCLVDSESEHVWMLITRENHDPLPKPLGGKPRVALTWLWLTNDGEVFQTFPTVAQPLPESYSVLKVHP